MKPKRAHSLCKRYIRQNTDAVESFIQENIGSGTRVTRMQEEYELKHGKLVFGKPDFCVLVDNPLGTVLVEAKSGESLHAQRKAGEQFKKWYNGLAGTLDGYPYPRGDTCPRIQISENDMAL